MARRKLVAEISSRKLTAQEIKVAYKRANEEVERLTNVFMHDTQYGKLSIGLKKWNDRIVKELGIDNMAIFHVKEKLKPK